MALEPGGRLPVVAIVGPTGTGKSDLAVALAQQFDGEIINADALQFYRGMDIGTAKMPVGERRGIPHHLLDILDVTQEAAVASFQTAARAAVRDVQGRGRLPLLVGGSGLYVRAALDRLEFPPTDPGTRARLEREAAGGIEPLKARLAEVDPESADRLGDDRRIIRALEVYELSGRPFSSYLPTREYVDDAVQIGLNMERSHLHQRLQDRVAGMAARGLLDEVRRLAGQGLRNGRTASRAIGYREYLDVLDGRIDETEAMERTVVATRKFARRQITWFGADPRVTWLDALDGQVLPKACDVVVRNLADRT
ncbi:tRNA (adenosine(37)-N6)-dimethylallyltransferase MiaA [Zhihengliuella salsuginis]|uniref:tRNA (adenosine(37)-N6)-dimethylallyltransferase MiaA n=1 Tax=Zhihengliuella salsuginis TaxID=578222 RepID=UPI001E45D28F|nr:tRNA (adenosine(37)-N6)-dimethylallyltransferase MiaA [Zhihengliuella salsuginis]